MQCNISRSPASRYVPPLSRSTRRRVLDRPRTRANKTLESETCIAPATYDHSTHAGNYGDVFKHGLLASLLDAVDATPHAFDVVLDTHAGAGVYAAEHQDHEPYVAHRAAELVPYQRILERVAREHGLYPGSPYVINAYAAAAGAQGRNVDVTLCEINLDVAAQLAQHCKNVKPCPRVLGGCDAWEALPRLVAERVASCASSRPKVLLFIDPPYVGGDDHGNLIAAFQALAPLVSACELHILAWFPLLPQLNDGTERLRDAAQATLRDLRNARQRGGAVLRGPRPPAATTASSRLLRGMALDCGADEMWASAQRSVAAAAPLAAVPVPAAPPSLRAVAADAGADELWAGLPEDAQARARVSGSGSAPASRGSLAPSGSNGELDGEAHELAYAWLESWRALPADAEAKGLNGCGMVYIGPAASVTAVGEWGFKLADVFVEVERSRGHPQAGCFLEVVETRGESSLAVVSQEHSGNWQ